MEVIILQKMDYIIHGKCLSSNGIKITSIVTQYGTPISIIINTGKDHDAPILSRAIYNMVVDHENKQYFLADSGYDSIKNNTILKNKGYIPIIPNNKRNNKGVIKEMSKAHKKYMRNV